MDKWESFQDTLFEYYLLFTCSRLLPFPSLTIFTFRLCSDFVLFLLTKYLVFFWVEPTLPFEKKNHLNGDWGEDSCKRSSGTPLAWLQSAPTTESRTVGSVSKKLCKIKKWKWKISINWWGESLCALVNPMVDSHPSKHSVMTGAHS